MTAAAERLVAALDAVPQTALTLKPWEGELLAAAHEAYPEMARMSVMLNRIPPRLRQVLDGLADITVPEGWVVVYNDGPLGIVLRNNDGYVNMVMPSTDDTGRWYIGSDYGLNAECNGKMGDTAQEAIDWLIGHAP